MPVWRCANVICALKCVVVLQTVYLLSHPIVNTQSLHFTTDMDKQGLFVVKCMLYKRFYLVGKCTLTLRHGN